MGNHKRRGKNKSNEETAKYSKPNKSICERQIYSKYKVQPAYSTQKVMLIDRYQDQGKYEASARIGNKEYFSFGESCTERGANENAVREAFAHLERENWPNDVSEPGITKRIIGHWDIHSWSKILNNETIALLFKDILLHFAGYQNIKYNTRVHHEGNLVGYTSEVTCNDETFKSLGLMTSEGQAEQSAAEICLRTLGYLPGVDNERALTIQPYEGGRFVKGYFKKPYIFTSKLTSDILEAFVASRCLMLPPKYYIKYVEPKRKNNVEVVECICCVDGKVFETSKPEPKSLAIQLAAYNAVKYFGISHPYERMEFRKHMHLYKHEFYEKEYLVTPSPTRNKSWLWSRFAREDLYKACEMSQTVKQLLNCKSFQSNLPTGAYQNEMIESEVKRARLFQGRLLSKLNDLCVAEIDEMNPNLVTIGNSDFSIKMWCTDGKIYSKQRESFVDILPGHNIHQLNCEYRALPFLEVYLHAVDCSDLLYPNPPEPVVTSCGVVLLFHNYSEESNDIYVLLKKNVDYKDSDTTSLKQLLNRLIQPKEEIEVTVAQVMEGIEQWNECDVKLLSEMSMDSVYQLMSKYVDDYDTRWNELFARPELPEELKELQDICAKEVKRLEEEKASNDANGVNERWELPQSEFLSSFGDTGIHVEGSGYCGMRSLAEMTGTKISLGDIEKCMIIDVPVDGDKKRHRGDVSRFYVWNRTEKKSIPGVVDPQPQLPEGYALIEKHAIEHNSTRYCYPPNKQIAQYYLHKVQYTNQDGTKVCPSRVLNAIVVCLPGDRGFTSYKRSAINAGRKTGVYVSPVLRYSENGERVCAVKVQRSKKEREYIFRSRTSAIYDDAEESVCKRALEFLGYKVPVRIPHRNAEEPVELMDPYLWDDINIKYEANLKKDDQVTESSQSNVDPYSITTDMAEENGGSENHGDIDIGSHVIADRNGDDDCDGDNVTGVDGDGDVNGVNDANVDNAAGVDGEGDGDGNAGNAGSGFENDNDVGMITPDEYSQVEDDDIAVNHANVNADTQNQENKNSKAAAKNDRRAKARKLRAAQKRPPRTNVPRRDAIRLQCELMLFDKAIDVCPMLKKIAETRQFQNLLNQFCISNG